MTSISEVPKPEAAPKQLFVRSKGVSDQKLPPLQVLQTFFSKFGTVVKITDGNKGRTFAFVTFLTAEQAKAAYDSINGSEVVDASKGVNLGRNLFVDFAMERGTKPAPRPTHVEAPRSAPRQAPVEAPRFEPALIPAPPQKPDLDVASANLPFVYIFPGQRPRIMSKPAMEFLFGLGSPPQTKFHGDTDVLIFGDGIQWVIPHPNNHSAIQECKEKYKYSYLVQIPGDVLTSKNFWRD